MGLSRMTALRFPARDPLFERELDIPGEFAIICRGAQANLAMTLADLEPGVHTIIEVTATPIVFAIALSLLIEVVPRVFRLSLPGNAKITDVELALRSHLAVGDLELAFVLMDLATDARTPVAKSSAADFDLSVLRLVAHPAYAYLGEDSSEVPNATFGSQIVRCQWSRCGCVSFHCD
jgi:hypothetical protein